MKKNKIIFTNIVEGVGIVSCSLGWIGFFYIAPVTIICGLLLLKAGRRVSGWVCIVMGTIALFFLINPPVSM